MRSDEALGHRIEALAGPLYFRMKQLGNSLGKAVTVIDGVLFIGDRPFAVGEGGYDYLLKVI